jgi:hypothetical protein
LSKHCKKSYKTKNIYFVFMHTAKSLNEKKIILFFHTENTKKIEKYVLACILALITSLLETWELG